MEQAETRYSIIAWNGELGEEDGADYGEINTNLDELKEKYEKLCKQYDHVELRTTDNGWLFDIILMAK